MPETFTVDVICAWCQKPMGTKDGFTEPGITHGICPECSAKHFPIPPPDGHKIPEKSIESHVVSGGGISKLIREG